MARVNQILRTARKTFKDLDLLKVLETELNHELSSMRFQNEKTGSSGDFVVEWDSPQSQDVLLRKKCSSGEEVAVSALLGCEAFQGNGRLPREAMIKVCVKKPSLSSILHFDCVAFTKGENESEFDVQALNYIPSASSALDSSHYSPIFSDLDPALQNELKQYLAARGIEENFTTFLLVHLHKKEQAQYMNWLQKVKDKMVQPD